MSCRLHGTAGLWSCPDCRGYAVPPQPSEASRQEASSFSPGVAAEPLVTAQTRVIHKANKSRK